MRLSDACRHSFRIVQNVSSGHADTMATLNIIIRVVLAQIKQCDLSLIVAILEKHCLTVSGHGWRSIHVDRSNIVPVTQTPSAQLCTILPLARFQARTHAREFSNIYHTSRKKLDV